MTPSLGWLAPSLDLVHGAAGRGSGGSFDSECFLDCEPDLRTYGKTKGRKATKHDGLVLDVAPAIRPFGIRHRMLMRFACAVALQEKFRSCAAGCLQRAHAERARGRGNASPKHLRGC